MSCENRFLWKVFTIRLNLNSTWVPTRNKEYQKRFWICPSLHCQSKSTEETNWSFSQLCADWLHRYPQYLWVWTEAKLWGHQKERQKKNWKSHRRECLQVHSCQWFYSFRSKDKFIMITNLKCQTQINGNSKLIQNDFGERKCHCECVALRGDSQNQSESHRLCERTLWFDVQSRNHRTTKKGKTQWLFCEFTISSWSYGWG